jgi:type IV pilus assembly protein PilV
VTKGITAQKGLTLLEILIALVVLSVGLLGIAGMQATGLRNNHAAYTKTQATALTMDMADRIRANPLGMASYNNFDTKVAVPADPGCIEAGCDPAKMAQFDKYQWSQPLVSTTNPILPEGRGVIKQNGDQFTVTLLWREPNTQGMTPNKCADFEAVTDDIACFQMSFVP